MFDARIRPMIDRLLAPPAAGLSRAGITADQVTLGGFAVGIAGAIAIAAGHPHAGLALILAGRIADGLDGAIARIAGPTERGGYLDIVLDFVVYAAVPMAFAFLDPASNALGAVVLLAGIVGNGSAFLAFAVMAERLQLKTAAQGQKSLYFIAGLAEGTETIAVYAAMCLWPAAFAPLAIGFGVLCMISTATRIVIAWRALGGGRSADQL